jgi:hypothetical protein
VKNEFNVDLSYCLETSIGSITLGENKNTFLTPEKFAEIGKNFCLILNEMASSGKLQEIALQIGIDEATILLNITNKRLWILFQVKQKIISQLYSKVITL